jgi:hypothetical protein
VSIQIGDIIMRKLKDGDVKKIRYRVIGETKHFYVCRSVKGNYLECFLKTDLGKEVFKA